jgi:hypothetical protein
MLKFLLKFANFLMSKLKTFHFLLHQLNTNIHLPPHFCSPNIDELYHIILNYHIIKIGSEVVEDVNGIHKTVEVLPRSNEGMVDDLAVSFPCQAILHLNVKRL